jgi:hypothetical protein
MEIDYHLEKITVVKRFSMLYLSNTLHYLNSVGRL